MSEDPKPGSPAWRDAQDKRRDNLLEHPETWTFQYTDEQKTKILTAYQVLMDEYHQSAPDLSQIKLMVGQLTRTEDENPLLFWQEFVGDMPDVFAGNPDLEGPWADEKIVRLLVEHKLKYMDWEFVDLVVEVKAPESLRNAAAELERLESEGYGLTEATMDQERFIVQYAFRRGTLRDPNKETSES